MNWKFNADEYQENNFQVIPIGDYRVRIAEAEEKKSSKGNDMIQLTLEVSGYNSTVRYYLPLMSDNTAITNQKLGEIFNSFGIANKTMNIKEWVGKVGACRIKHELYNDEERAKVGYFIKRDKQETLPPFASKKVNVSAEMFDVLPAEDLPF